MSSSESQSTDTNTFTAAVNRRRFLQSTAGVGAGLILTQRKSLGAPATKKLRVGLVGLGRQGETLMNAAQNIPNFDFQAVCDIMRVPRLMTARTLENRGNTATPYEDIDQMLDAEKDKLDCVMIAVPDIEHAPYTIKCLEAGLHVYCEKMMSNTIAGAASMVVASQKTGKLLQIGHQRRSNPRYQHVRSRVLMNGVLGQVTHCRAQWNRGWSASLPIAPKVPKGSKGKAYMETLEKYGYETPFQFTNWRNFRKFGGGPISDLGAHQIDMLGWMLTDPDAKTEDGLPATLAPASLVANGGLDYWVKDRWKGDGPDQYENFDYDHNDNVLAIYEFKTAKGETVRGYYQVLTTTSSEAYYEVFMGDEGTMRISEDSKIGQAYKEKNAPSWDKYTLGKVPTFIPKPEDRKLWAAPNPWKRPKKYTALSEYQKSVDARASAPLKEYWIENFLQGKALHQPHIENFFEAVRANDGEGDKTMLNCPGEEAFKTAVAVISCNTAIEEGRRIDFKPEDYIAKEVAVTSAPTPEPTPAPDPAPTPDPDPAPTPAPDPAPAENGTPPENP